MPSRDLRDWMQRVAALGQLEEVRGAHWDLEIGALVSELMLKTGRPALLFDDIPGYPRGYRVLGNVLTSVERLACTIEATDLGSHPLDVVRRLKAFWAAPRQIAPQTVAAGPVLTHVQRGSQVNLWRFPTPRWHEEDGGRYLGTGCAVIMRDPDTGWVNLGAYRVVVHDERTLGVRIARGRHGDMIMKKYWQRGEPCPVAISMGHDPLLLVLSGIQVPLEVGEYDIAGGIRGEAVPVVPGPVTGLPVPANAEIVVEGYMPPEEYQDEGPFGEWHGYYASGHGVHGFRPCPVVKVESVLHRDDPIILGVLPGHPPNDNTYYLGYMSSAMIWQQMEAAGVPGITGVWQMEAGGARMFQVVAIRQMYPGHAKQALMSATSTHSGTYANRFVVVVDEDIDPTDIHDVIWAISTRTDPRDDVEVVKKCWSGPADPMAYPLDQRLWNSRCLIDACRPWDQLAEFARVVRVTPDLRRQVAERWGDLLHRCGV